jgi:hypothetical protein
MTKSSIIGLTYSAPLESYKLRKIYYHMRRLTSRKKINKTEWWDPNSRAQRFHILCNLSLTGLIQLLNTGNVTLQPTSNVWLWAQRLGLHSRLNKELFSSSLRPDRSVKLATPLELVSGLRMGGALLLRPRYTFTSLWLGPGTLPSTLVASITVSSYSVKYTPHWQMFHMCN